MWLSSNCDGIEALLLAVSGGGGGCCDTWALDMLHWGHQSLVYIPFLYIYIYVFCKFQAAKHFSKHVSKTALSNAYARESLNIFYEANSTSAH